MRRAIVITAALGAWGAQGRGGEAAGVRLARVPAGSFLMGSADGDTDAYDDEKPQHRVAISADFWLMETEVSQGLYAAVTGQRPWDTYERREYEGVPLANPRYPAIYVSWCDAVAFANLLSIREGLRPAYRLPRGFAAGMRAQDCEALAPAVAWHRPASGYRLPTEAEWEYAAREGPEGSRYAGTSDLAALRRYANIADPAARARFGWEWDAAPRSDGRMALAPTGSLAASGWGLKDMTGNAWEWAFDGYAADAYARSAEVDPVVYGGDSRVIRGGSWYYFPRVARAAVRSGNPPGFTSFDLGFRLARAAAPGR